MATDDTDAPTIVLPEPVRDGLLAHAREGAPEEVCGVLAGTREEGAAGGNRQEGAASGNREDGEATAEQRVETRHRVEIRHPAENVAETPRTRYEIDPREQLALMEAVEDAGREVVGFYHSHPRGPAGPSAIDAAQATWPGRSYVIVSLGGGDGEISDDDGAAGADGEASVGSWRWTGEEFVGEAVRFVDRDSV